MPPQLVLCLLLVLLAVPWPSEAAATAGTKPLLLSLRARQMPARALPRQPSKLRFHHNVSLTVSLAVGTPPQNVTMVLDTGSELSWLLCAPAGGGGVRSNATTTFHPRASASFAAVPCASAQCRSRDLPSPPACDGASRRCRVSLSYADGSSSDGALATDVFAIGSATAAPPVRAAFGCMSSAFDSSPDGVASAGLLGMNRGALSFISQASTRRFSYCISDRDDAGVLLLGHSDLPTFLPLNYTPLYQPARPLPYFDRVAYSVQLLGIRVGSKHLPIPASVLAPDHTGAGQTMVDSGTQFTFLLGDAYAAVKAEFLRQTRPLPLLRALDDEEPGFAFQEAFDTCFRVPRGRAPPAARLPRVTLLFNGAEMAVGGDRLLYKVPGERRGGGDAVWCLTFGNADLVPIMAYVIGHHHQMNLWVEYDLERGRVGLAPVRCDVASERLGLML